MDEVRQENVAHHIYQVQGTGEEIAIDNRIILTLRHDDPALLEQIIDDFGLVAEGRMGDAYILRVTEATGRNPLRTANAILEREGVASCEPEVLIPNQIHQPSLTSTHRLFRNQWYLSGDMKTHLDLVPDAGIRAPEAWQITFGSPDIVIGVIDDGFDLTHPAFRNKRIHPASRDFAVAPADNSPLSESADYHGTCVASVATASLEGDGMIGVAPRCTLLPIRIGFGRSLRPSICSKSFVMPRATPTWSTARSVPDHPFDRFSAPFRQAITELTRTGGRRGKGLVIVFSAGNDDTPTFLRGADNLNGVSFTQNTSFGMEIGQLLLERTCFPDTP
jgi:hypothetical protein